MSSHSLSNVILYYNIMLYYDMFGTFASQSTRNTSGNCGCGCSLLRPAFQVDQQLALNHIEELVVMIVLVPVILAFDHAQAHHRTVHLAKRLVVPLVRSRIGERLLIDQLQMFVQHIEASVIGILGSGAHSLLLSVSRRVAKSRV